MANRTIVWTPPEGADPEQTAGALDVEINRHSSRGWRLLSANLQDGAYLLTFDLVRRRR